MCFVLVIDWAINTQIHGRNMEIRFKTFQLLHVKSVIIEAAWYIKSLRKLQSFNNNNNTHSTLSSVQFKMKIRILETF